MSSSLSSILPASLIHYQDILLYLYYFVIVVGISQNIIYLLQIPFAVLEAYKNRILRNRESHTFWISTSDIALPISIFVPAYNEGVVIIKSVYSALTLEYPTYEVLVINDGSTDDTLEKLIEEFELQPSYRAYEYLVPCESIQNIYTSFRYSNLVVIDKKNGGKGDAMNAAINIAKYPICCTLDADSILDPSALTKAIQPFIDQPEHTVAVGGTVGVLNGAHIENGLIQKVHLPKKILALFQIIEYLRAFLIGRLALSQLGILTIISGAFAIIQRESLIEVGGFDRHVLGEDYDLILKIHKYKRQHGIPYRICFSPEPVCWTEVPESMEVLKSQRIRWQQGALEIFFKNIGMFANPRYGKIGLIHFPLALLFDVLGPIAEVIGYVLLLIFYYFGAINTDFFLALTALFFISGIFQSISSLILEEMLLKRMAKTKHIIIMGLVAIIENFGYRQINAIWRIIGWWRFIRKKHIWGKMTRVGID